MLKSALSFASNHSQNHFVKVFQAFFADSYLFIQDRIFNVPRWVGWQCKWGGNANVVVFIDCKDNKLKRNEQW